MHTQAVDTAKFTFGTKYLANYNPEYFREVLSKRKSKDGKPYTIMSFIGKEHPTHFPGINYMRIDTKLNLITVDVSSKILLGDYWRKINETTLSKVFYNLNKTKLISLTDIEELIENVIMPTSHACIDFEGDYNPAIIHMLKVLHQRKDYEFTNYKDSSFNSVNFKKIRSSLQAKEFGRLYNKLLEFNNPSNSYFRGKLTTEETVIITDFFRAHPYRAEVVLGCSSKSRSFYKIPESEPLNALKILRSRNNPVNDMFEQFMKEVPTSFSPTVSTQTEKNSLKFYFTTELTEKEKGDFYYLELSGFNLEKIRYALREQYVVKSDKPRAATVTERMKKLTLLNTRWEAFKARITQTDLAMLAEMMQKIQRGNTNDILIKTLQDTVSV